MPPKSTRLLAGMLVSYLLLGKGMIALSFDEVDDSPTRQATRRPLQAVKAWGQIQNGLPQEQELEAKGGIEYWGRIGVVILSAFNEMFADNPPSSAGGRESMKYFVDQFGRHGTRADMCWVIALHMSRASPEVPLLRSDENVFAGQIAMAEFQTRQFVDDEDRLARFYQSLIWYDRYIANSIDVYTMEMEHFVKTVPRDKVADHKEYWWHARNFVLLAHATNRDDLFADVAADELYPQMESWLKWISDEGPYLRASATEPRWKIDPELKKRNEGYVPFLQTKNLPQLIVRPKFPLPNWDAPPPGTPREHWAFE